MTKKKQLSLLISGINYACKTKQFYFKMRFFSYAMPFLEVLKKNGYIYGFKRDNTFIVVYLKYFKNKSVLINFNLKCNVSTKKYFKSHSLQDNAIYSTSFGFFLGKELKKKKIGGELLAVIS